MTKRCGFLKYVFDVDGHSKPECTTIKEPEHCPKERAKCSVTQTCWQVKTPQTCPDCTEYHNYCYNLRERGK